MNTEESIRSSFSLQAYWCDKLGSPFTATMCRLLGERLDASTAVGRKTLGWTGDPTPLADNLPLRVAGSLNGLVLNGQAPKLAAFFPPHPAPEPNALWREIDATLHAHEAALLARMEKAPQTNEVGRAGALMVGLLTLADELGHPFELFEMGCSAGLNLNLARFSYDLGGVVAGEAGSPVHIAPSWTGPAPPAADVRILAARGVDISPLKVTDAGDRELLTAYVWPDQLERLARVRAAIEIARAHPPRIDTDDAAAWVERVVEREPKPGVTRVLYDTIAFQYFPAASQARIRAHAARVGALATREAPFAWLRYETDPEYKFNVSLRLTLWPTGEERVLGTGHAHGTNFHNF